MSSAVNICNSALIKLGQERINSLDDDNKRARLCKEQYYKVLRRVLRSHPWNFAIKRATLTESGDSVTWGEEKLYALPSDCVRVYGVEGKYFKYKIEGRYIVTSDGAPNIKYISDDVDEYLYDASFAEAVASWLAADLCYALTQSASLKEGLLREGEFWVSQARSVGAQEQTVDSLQFDDWDDSRW
jgi:hypothetical protein